MAPPHHLVDPAPPKAWRHRPGLDGLRGLAVAAVVVFHLDERWLPGGFLGVDVFFTLSGFLITGLLLVELRDRGRLDLAGFWSRRARRLLPAVLLLIVLMAALLPSLDPVERGRRVPELLAALAYVANWQLIHAGTSYFSSFVDPSPVRHLWSLAIEEQFYLAWPLVVLVVRSRTALIVTTAVGIAASIAAMAVLYDAAEPTRAYFGTDARIHQILIGALAAMLLTRLPAVRGRTPSVVGLVSLGGLAWMAWTVDGSTSWYFHGGSVLVACFTVGVIVAAEDLSGACSRALAVRPLVALGLISYGVYLWHWPVIVLIDADTVGLRGPSLAAVQVAVTLVVSLLSYVLVERPIRRGHLGAWTLNPPRLARLVPTSLVAMAALVLVAGLGRTTDPLQAAGVDGGVQVLGNVARPTEDTAAAQGRPTVTADPPKVRSVAVVGDSVAYLWIGSLWTEAHRRGLPLIGAAAVSCQVGYDALYTPRGTRQDKFETACADKVPAAHRQVRELAPDLVLWHDVNASYARMSDDGRLLIDGPEWEEKVLASWDDALAVLEGPTTTVVIILPPWRSVDPPGCAGAARPDRCHQVQDQDTRIRSATRDYLQRHADDPHVVGIDIDDLVCPAMPCPVEVDGVRLRGYDPDLTHFTGDGAARLAPKLLDRAIAAAEAAATSS